jgi:hypothetical protein
MCPDRVRRVPYLGLVGLVFLIRQQRTEIYPHLRALGYTKLFVCPLNRPSSDNACDIIDITAK